MTTRCTACGKPTPHYGFYTTCTACDVKDQIEQSRIKVGAAGAVREYLDLIERRLLDAAMLPPMALDRPSSGAAAAAEAEVQRYKVQWNIPGTALAAEERRQRRDDRVEALQYALSGYRRHGKGEAMRLAEERGKHFQRAADAEVRWLHEQGIPLADIEMVQHGPLLGDE